MVAALTLAACAPTLVPQGAHRAEGDGQLVVKKDGHCLYLTPEYGPNGVRACETRRDYKFVAGATEQVVDKHGFRTRLREALAQFARTGEYRWATLAEAQIEIWVTAPVLTPAEARLTAVVLSKAGNFAVELPFDPAGWDVREERLTLLGGARYPSWKSQKAGVVAVEARPGADRARLDRFLARTLESARVRGLLSSSSIDGAVDASAWPLLTIRTKAFSEGTVARALLQAPRSKLFVEDVSLVPAGEREAARGLAFRFPFKPGPKTDDWSLP